VPNGTGTRNSGTTGRILDVAEGRLQARGYNGFSYADVAGELGITRAALHYHFPGKAELGEALIARYADRFSSELARLDAAATDAPATLAGFVDLYTQTLRRQRMCLCGMLAAEYLTLPPAMQRGVTAFFEDSSSWLQTVLERGRREGTLMFVGAAADSAAMVMGGLEGAMLITRMSGDVEGFRAAAARLVAGLIATADEIPAA
jgi:TetR/AcrR family transcriptional regulator, transcriptional repressor for nem operon